MNWGNKLLITFIVFGAGISYLVYRSLNTSFELVEKDYYKNELQYQQVIDGTKRANALASPVKLQKSGDQIVLHLPEEMKNKDILGDVWFYCAYDSRKDRKFTLNTDAEGSQSFHSSSILPGNYTVKIKWNENGKNYYSENNLTVF
ncbi:MAG: FixH family protein [Chitinophagaceae bacterium]|nr:FixH family protein [Chitinophagaceae bacterium]